MQKYSIARYALCAALWPVLALGSVAGAQEQPHAADNLQAIRRAFVGVGTALIMTTAVLVAGFAIVTFSDSRDHRIFATMGALTIAAALFCDLVFLPALLSLFASPKRKA